MNDLKSRATGKEIPKEEKPIEKATIVDLRDPTLISQLKEAQRQLHTTTTTNMSDKEEAEKTVQTLLEKLNTSQHEALEKVKDTLPKSFQQGTSATSVDVSALETHLLSAVKLATSNRASSDPKSESTLEYDFFSRLLKDDAEFITQEFQTGVKVLPPLFQPGQTVYFLQHFGDDKSTPSMLAEVVLLVVTPEKNTTELVVVELKSTTLNNPSVYLKEGGKTETGIVHFYAHNQAIEGVAPLSTKMFLELVHQGATKQYAQRLARYLALSHGVVVSSVTCISIIGNYWDSSKAGIWSVPLRTVGPKRNKDGEIIEEEVNKKEENQVASSSSSSKAIAASASSASSSTAVMIWEDSHQGQLQTSAYGRKYL